MRENLEFLVEAELVPDYAEGIKKYLKANRGAPQTGPVPNIAPATFDGVQFSSLVNDGIFSSDPNDTSVPRPVRANNPGALLAAAWNRARPGFVGTLSDGSGVATAVYRTPEHGIASWYYLVKDRYGFAAGKRSSIADLVQRYSGGDKHYEQVLRKFLPAQIVDFDTGNDQEMLVVARAFFAVELGRPVPWRDEQILFAIKAEKTQSLPQ